MKPTCMVCGSVVDPNDMSTLREITGFDRERTQGGQNHVRFRRETGRLVCGTCATRWLYSGMAEQQELWP